MRAIKSIARHILMTMSILGLVLAAHAETYPSGVIRIVVPTGPGTPPDVIGRVIATELSEAEGWRMIVENKPGALQTIGMSDVLKQPADGYTIYSMSVPTAAVPASMPNLGMRPDVDFTPIVKVSKSYNALVVAPFPAKSISELVAVLKQNPGKYNFSSAGFGTPAHLIGEMFKLQAGIQAIHVPYQQSQQRIGDLLNGTNQFDFLATVTVGEFVESGRLRALWRDRA